MKQGKPLSRKTPLKAKKQSMNRSSGMTRKSSLQQTGNLNSGAGLKKGGAPLKRNPPAPKAERGHTPRPEKKPTRKPLQNKPPKVTKEERQTRKLVELRSDGFCEKCGIPGATDKAHRISRGVGGGWEPANILDLCRDCHKRHHANPITARKGGWHLLSGSAPEECPVWLHHQGDYGLAYLHNDGTFTWATKTEDPEDPE